MGISQKTDLLIIGSGPAGLSTALHLLKKGASWADRMLILEKDAHPRPKLCGGGITRLGLDLLRDLGIQYPLPVPAAQVDDVRLIYNNRTIHVRGKPQFMVVDRSDFDDYLAQTARQSGAVIHENEEVDRLEPGESFVRVETNIGVYHARCVVAADGSMGVGRRLIRDTGKSSQAARLLEVVTNAPENAAHFSDRFARFDFTPVNKDLQGYFWVFPTKVNNQPCFNIGVYDARIARKRPRANLPKILKSNFQKRIETNDEIELAGHPVHWFAPTNRFSLPRILLAGDAAGVDPLFGEGIAPALAYGKVAADTLQRAFQTGDFSFRDYRRRILASRLGWYLCVRWFIAWTCYHLSGKPRLMHSLWTFGDWLARKWPEPRPLNFQETRE